MLNEQNESEKFHKSIDKISYLPIDANLVITDLESTLYGFLKEKSNPSLEAKDIFHRPLSSSMLELTKKWKNIKLADNIDLVLQKDNTIKLIKNDKLNYASQLIFPLFDNNIHNGFAIIFKTSYAFSDELVKFIKKEMLEVTFLKK